MVGSLVLNGLDIKMSEKIRRSAEVQILERDSSTPDLEYMLKSKQFETIIESDNIINELQKSFAGSPKRSLHEQDILKETITLMSMSSKKD